MMTVLLLIIQLWTASAEPTMLTYSTNQTPHDFVIVLVYPAGGTPVQACSRFYGREDGREYDYHCWPAKSTFGEVDTWRDYHFDATAQYIVCTVTMRLRDGSLKTFYAYPKNIDS